MESRKDEIIPATLESVNYDGKLWGMPQQTNAAFLFYRTDHVSEPPETWQEVYETGADERHRLPGRTVRGADRRLPRRRSS
jgi:maltose-binding protein MalE